MGESKVLGSCPIIQKGLWRDNLNPETSSWGKVVAQKLLKSLKTLLKGMTVKPTLLRRWARVISITTVRADSRINRQAELLNLHHLTQGHQTHQGPSDHIRSLRSTVKEERTTLYKQEKTLNHLGRRQHKEEGLRHLAITDTTPGAH